MPNMVAKYEIWLLTLVCNIVEVLNRDAKAKILGADAPICSDAKTGQMNKKIKEERLIRSETACTIGGLEKK